MQSQPINSWPDAWRAQYESCVATTVDVAIGFSSSHWADVLVEDFHVPLPNVWEGRVGENVDLGPMSAPGSKVEIHVDVACVVLSVFALEYLILSLMTGDGTIPEKRKAVATEVFARKRALEELARRLAEHKGTEQVEALNELTE